MVDLQLIKQKIYEDDNLEKLLSALGCENIDTEQGGDLIVAQLPPSFDSDNIRSIQIKNTEKLSANIRTRGIAGDIYSIVGYILYKDECKDSESVNAHLHKIKTYICHKLGYEHLLKHNHIETPKNDWNGWLKEIKKSRSKKVDLSNKENEILPESVLNDYLPYGHHAFLKDGISFWTQHQFEVKYDTWTNRIVFPIRNKYGQLIGVKGRYVGNNKITLEQTKYLYLYPCDKSIELFNLHRALPFIQEKNEVIVVEGAKSCMLLHQWGYPNCVSIEGNTLDPVQAMLLKELNVQIVFAFDKDIYTPKGVFDLEFLQRQIKQIKNRVMHVIIDTADLLKDHDSPIDKGKSVWDMLYTDFRHVMTSVN